MINRELTECSGAAEKTRAIGRNHSLWSILVKDLSLAENRLPEGMKAHLIGLGLWVMRYSTLALLRDLPLQPLIEVNGNVLDGLLAQADAAQNGAVPAGAFSA